jgi:hypothetical protein
MRAVLRKSARLTRPVRIVARNGMKNVYVDRFDDLESRKEPADRGVDVLQTLRREPVLLFTPGQMAVPWMDRSRRPRDGHARRRRLHLQRVAKDPTLHVVRHM